MKLQLNNDLFDENFSDKKILLKMIARRDRFLQELGIIRWRLRRPILLNHAVGVILSRNIRLLLIADIPPLLSHPFVVDVARSMDLIPIQLRGITPSQVIALPDEIHCHCWWLGLPVLRSCKGISLKTQSLEVLLEDANAKRDLWHQIGSSEYYNVCNN